MNITPETKDALIRVTGLCTMAFFLMMTYAIARPASESLFLSAYGSKSLPYVWIAVAIAVLVVVSFYNRAVVQTGLLTLFVKAIGIISAFLILLILARNAHVPGATFVLYIWKDVYIIVLIEIFWSFANTVFPIRTAKWAYGLFCIMGSMGGIIGNLGVGKLAATWGTSDVLWMILPVFAMLGLTCIFFRRIVGDVEPTSKDPQDRDLRAGWNVLRKSSYLVFLLFLIATVQIAITLIDYQYNKLLEVTYVATNERTAIIGQIYAMIDMTSLTLQLMTGLILSYVGVPLTLLAIPFVLGLAIGGFVMWPGFFALAIAKIISKSTNYSIFKAAKEILYIPLNYKEKTQGKAIVDILSYRFAKGLASLVLLLLIAFQLQAPQWFVALDGVLQPAFKNAVALSNSILVSLFTMSLLVLWIWLTWVIVRRYRANVSQEDEEQL